MNDHAVIAASDGWHRWQLSGRPSSRDPVKAAGWHSSHAMPEVMPEVMPQKSCLRLSQDPMNDLAVDIG